MSRSRSRMSMDWRPDSRSRSRPPYSKTASYVNPEAHYSSLLEGDEGEDSGAGHQPRPSVPFPSTEEETTEDDADKNELEQGSTSATSYTSSSAIPIPSPSRHSRPDQMRDVDHPDHGESSRPSSSYRNRFESRSPSDFYNHSLSALNTPAFLPSSLPSFGLYGPPTGSALHKTNPTRQPKDALPFPRHVRKTSFDHTVSRAGILQGGSGRHQVNGKPLPPDSNLVRAQSLPLPF
jgi:hypothetical protein